TPSPTAATRPTRTAAAAPAPLPTSTVTPTVSPAPIAAATAAPAASATAATQISRVRQQPYLPGLPWVVVGLILTGVVIAGWAHVSGYTRGRNNDG
ncbi:MAG: hypothetical protein JXB35_13245, partial [Anaerolineae bacterium]|nr:hypothetical protein [Anaerolineae bacterium]